MTDIENPRIEFADDQRIQAVQEEADDLLKLIGINWAFVTDLSRLSDFSPTEQELELVNGVLGYPSIDELKRHYLYELAERLREVRNRNNMTREEFDELYEDQEG